jgi:pimeloyl-ACP methyl ester carboxylesterase/DNA-binding CsgD family transcriptional regulator
MRQSIHFATSFDGARIAWAVAGRGPALVRAPTWLSHIEHDWQSPVSRHWIAEFTRDHRLLRIDPRGVGMSEWDVAELSFDAMVRDVEAAVDAAGLERFAMVGNSGGAAVAIAYAARHPDRVSRLFLWGSYCRGALRRGTPTAAQLDHAQMLRKLAEMGWGSDEPTFRQVFASLLVPGATKEQWTQFTDRMRLCCSGRNAARFLAMMEQIDVQAEARQVRCPTLVLHSRHETRNPYEEGKLTAALIPGAEFVPLDSRNHILLPDERAWQQLVAEFRRFLAVGPPRADFAGLSDRERDVLELIARGLDNEAIARALRLSGKTVGNHITRIFAKCGVRTRAQAIVQARELGFGQARADDDTGAGPQSGESARGAPGPRPQDGETARRFN